MAADMNRVAEQAYNAYCLHVGGKASNGDDLPTWEQQNERSPAIAAAWRFAAAAAVVAHEVFNSGLLPNLYRRRQAETVPAIRLDNAEDSAKKVAEWCGGEATVDTNPDGSEPMHFVSVPNRHGRQLAAPGSWVVARPDGEFHVYEDESFRRYYTLA
jgi:hypothetical protein